MLSQRSLFMEQRIVWPIMSADAEGESDMYLDIIMTRGHVAVG